MNNKSYDYFILLLTLCSLLIASILVFDIPSVNALGDTSKCWLHNGSIESPNGVINRYTRISDGESLSGVSDKYLEDIFFDILEQYQNNTGNPVGNAIFYRRNDNFYIRFFHNTVFDKMYMDYASTGGVGYVIWENGQGINLPRTYVSMTYSSQYGYDTPSNNIDNWTVQETTSNDTIFTIEWDGSTSNNYFIMTNSNVYDIDTGTLQMAYKNTTTGTTCNFTTGEWGTGTTVPPTAEPENPADYSWWEWQYWTGMVTSYIVNPLADWFIYNSATITNVLTNEFGSLLNPINVIKTNLDAVGLNVAKVDDIINLLNPLTLIENTSDAIKSVNMEISDMVQLAVNLANPLHDDYFIKQAVVPSSTYFDEFGTNVKDIFYSKFQFAFELVEHFNTLADTVTNNTSYSQHKYGIFDTLVINYERYGINNLKIINLDAIGYKENYKATVDMILIFLGWTYVGLKILKKLPRLIH